MEWTKGCVLQTCQGLQPAVMLSEHQMPHPLLQETVPAELHTRGLAGLQLTAQLDSQVTLLAILSLPLAYLHYLQYKSFDG